MGDVAGGTAPTARDCTIAAIAVNTKRVAIIDPNKLRVTCFTGISKKCLTTLRRLRHPSALGERRTWSEYSEKGSTLKGHLSEIYMGHFIYNEHAGLRTQRIKSLAGLTEKYWHSLHSNEASLRLLVTFGRNWTARELWPNRFAVYPGASKLHPAWPDS